jgi:dolichyl-phosphate-mannose-protein mannosyltransferase
VLGAALRLYRLDAMEFKFDEQQGLTLAAQLLADRPWATGTSWPTHGMVSSHGVGNAPLFTWIVALLWSVAGNPVGVVALIAAMNAGCLYPLWRWARRHMDEERALLMLAIFAVSPFAVLFSRKIWTQDLLLPGITTLLWAIEWLRGDRAWRGLAVLGLAALLIGQLHQAGAIAMLVLPIALGWQAAIDRRGPTRGRWSRPSAGECMALAMVVAANVFFWLPYLEYLRHVSPAVLAGRPLEEGFLPTLLIRVGGQILPFDLFTLLKPGPDGFLTGTLRPAVWYSAGVLGAPLFVHGLWRWLRAPLRLPVVGAWWWCVIALFTLGRIPGHPAYVLVLAPLTAVLAAGGFDPEWPDGIRRTLIAWRSAYVVALCGLTSVVLAWVVHCGGDAGDYGAAYNRRLAQAKSIVVRGQGGSPAPLADLGELPAGAAGLKCGPAPAEVRWLVHWLGGPDPDSRLPFTVCDAWVVEGTDRVYRWTIRADRGDR